MANRALIQSLPKCELHLHLEGTIEPPTLVELSRKHDAVPLTLEQAQGLYEYADFHGFMLAFKAVTQRLLTAADYELITYRLMEKLQRQNVVHAEVFVSVGAVYWRQHEFEPLFEGMERGRMRGEQDFGVSLFWIFDAVRHFGVEPAERVFELATRLKNRNVIGIGIGGDERRGAAEPFRALYDYAAEHGLRRTAHAGETTGPGSIWDALNIGAERIGHGLTAVQDSELIEVLAQRQVPVEVCVTSNVRTQCLNKIEDHPLRRMFDEGLLVTLNSDDPAMFHTSLIHEYEIAQDVFGFTDEHVRELARNSIESSFLPAEKKAQLLDRFDAVLNLSS
ncbi:MAG: adenosine deaminase [Acidobacteria bacterium]|nr:adenosine deaminase [Acidobacteriota bacterium]MBV9146301.1 adenosine deaminase [Acidobacteriota bacterium]MBV9434455.1 adenosine deaminase [Acidobacteriota bacterium]